MTHVYYDPGSGDLLHTATLAPGIDPARIGPAWIVVEAAPADLHLWRVVDGELVEREGAAEIALQQARESASLSRSEFLLACVSAGLLTPQDALLAAKGELPAAYASVIEGWPEAQQFEAGLRWAALTQVERLHPLILAVAAAMDIPDPVLDALFGIEAAQ